jgi:hypothetical protein
LKQFAKQYDFDTQVKPVLEANTKLQREISKELTRQRGILLEITDMRDRWLQLPTVDVSRPDYQSIDEAFAAECKACKVTNVTEEGQQVVVIYVQRNMQSQEPLFCKGVIATILQRLLDLQILDSTVVTMESEPEAPKPQPTLAQKIEALPHTEGREISKEAYALVEEGWVEAATPMALAFLDYMAITMEVHMNAAQLKAWGKLFLEYNMNPLRPESYDESRKIGIRRGLIPQSAQTTEEEIERSMKMWEESHRASGNVPSVRAYEIERKRRLMGVKNVVPSFAEYWRRK